MLIDIHMAGRLIMKKILIVDDEEEIDKYMAV